MQSFDAFLPDGRSVTAEYAGAGWWALFLFDADGHKCDKLGTKEGTAAQMMIYAESLAEAIALAPVTA